MGPVFPLSARSVQLSTDLFGRLGEAVPRRQQQNDHSWQRKHVEDEEHDIGHLFHTWFHALGVPDEKMEYLNNGQPLPVAHDDCGPIQGLLA